MLAGLLPLAFLSLACGLGDAISDLATPDGRIAAASRTPACDQELRGALQQYRTQQGMGFGTTDAMIQELFTAGDTQVSYTRDGNTYTPHFAIDASGGGCQLAYYQLTTQRPGNTQAQLFEYRMALGDACTCELPPE